MKITITVTDKTGASTTITIDADAEIKVETVPASQKTGSVTYQELEVRLMFRSARINDLARHFNVDTQTIIDLITAPGSRTKRVERGWLKIVIDAAPPCPRIV